VGVMGGGKCAPRKLSILYSNFVKVTGGAHSSTARCLLMIKGGVALNTVLMCAYHVYVLVCVCVCVYCAMCVSVCLHVCIRVSFSFSSDGSVIFLGVK
jgi:hypothetical protein